MTITTKELKTFYREYIDVLGSPRKLKYIGSANLIIWHKGTSDYAIAELWQDETSRILQIPSNAWSILKISYIDTKEK